LVEIGVLSDNIIFGFDLPIAVITNLPFLLQLGIQIVALSYLYCHWSIPLVLGGILQVALLFLTNSPDYGHSIFKDFPIWKCQFGIGCIAVLLAFTSVMGRFFIIADQDPLRFIQPFSEASEKCHSQSKESLTKILARFFVRRRATSSVLSTSLRSTTQAKSLTYVPSGFE
jgi:hypothetical protein